MSPQKRKSEKQKNKSTDDNAIPLVTHLAELRRRFIYVLLFWLMASAGCYFFAADIYEFLVRPLADILIATGQDRRLIYTGLTEVFFSYIKLSLFAGAVIMFPVLAMQIWGFVAPALYKKEKQVFIPLLFLTPILFFTGAAFLYFGILPLAWNFFLGFENPDTVLPIQLEAKVSEYLSLVMKLIFAFGIAFQLPILLFLLAKAGFLTSDILRRKRKYALIIIFIAAAVLTPPDLVSQIALAVPVYILYELSIFLIALILRK